ncbi:MAG: family 43 glycosylhydrolase [Fastidiosipilaceae bacterium]|jgi:arabinan endo-1,5-alpha-L-arabinosidase
MKRKIGFTLILCTLLVGCTPPVSSETLPPTSEDVVTSQSSEEVPTTYENPVWEPVLADPAVIRADDGTYYAYGTQDNALWGDYFGVRYTPILSSTNLVDWEYRDQAFKPATMPTWSETSGAGLWAPDIVKIGNTYNLYYSLSAWGDPNPGIGVATGPSPLGPFTDQGKIFDSNEIGVYNSIDQAVFVDTDNRVYMFWGSFSGIYAVELTADGLSVKGTIAEANANKVLVAGVDNKRWDIGNYEGAYIIRERGYYYMFLSTGTCCEGHHSTYEVRVCRSESILGPYYDKAGNLMTYRQNLGTLVVRGNDDFAGVGHNSIVKDDAGESYIVYHGFDKFEDPYYGTTNRRALLIDKLVWDKEHWPSVEGLGPSRGAERPYIAPR